MADSASWILKYWVGGQQRYVGLGPWPLVSLADARTKADEMRKQRSDGLDPLQVKRARLAGLEQGAGVRLRGVADAYREGRRAEWKPSHARGVRNELDAIEAKLGDLDVAKLDTTQVLNYLCPLWSRSPQTPAPSTARGWRSWWMLRLREAGAAET